MVDYNNITNSMERTDVERAVFKIFGVDPRGDQHLITFVTYIDVDMCEQHDVDFQDIKEWYKNNR